MKKARPRCLKISRRTGGTKSFFHELRSFRFWSTQQRAEQFDFRETAEERQDHRLDRQVLAPGCERVAPRFQIMGERNVPGAERRRGVLVVTKSYNLRHLFLESSPIKRQLCLPVLCQTAFCIVHRITAKNEKLLDPTIVYVRCQL